MSIDNDLFIIPIELINMARWAVCSQYYTKPDLDQCVLSRIPNPPRECSLCYLIIILIVFSDHRVGLAVKKWTCVHGDKLI